MPRHSDPATPHAICEDYRAAAAIDLVHDAADGSRRIAVPLLGLWGAKGTVGKLYDVLDTWREKATDVQAGHSPAGIPCKRKRQTTRFASCWCSLALEGWIAHTGPGRHLESR